MAKEKSPKAEFMSRRVPLASSIFILASLFLSLFFLSPNLSGNAIGSIDLNTTNWIGIVLFAMALIVLFGYSLRRR